MARVTVAGAVRIGAARCLALDALAVRAVATLAAAGVPAVLIKGPATTRLLYPGDGGRRPYVDVDLLVAPSTFDAAQAALTAAGYRPLAPPARETEWAWQERSWQAPGPGRLLVDLHRGFSGVARPTVLWTAVAAGASGLALAGGTVPVPDDAGCALFVGLHTARDVDKPLADLVRALDTLPDTVWAAAAALAGATGASTAFAAGLRRTPAGGALADRLGLPARVPPPQFLRAAGASSTGYALGRLAAEHGVLARLRWIACRLLPAPGPRAGSALVRLAGHARRLPRGLVELRAATSQAPPRARGGTTVWSARAGRSARRQLRAGPLAEVDLPAPPSGLGGVLPVRAGLRLVGASCLERALVRQRWYAARGAARDLVVGVTGPAAGFRAHAWLAGEDAAGTTVITRRPPPPHWLGRQDR